MSASNDLLIVSAKAARRLRLLQLPQLGGTAAAAAADGPATTAPPLVAADGSLPVALLAEPVHAAASSSWQHDRDVLLEVAVTLPTLQALKVGGAALAGQACLVRWWHPAAATYKATKCACVAHLHPLCRAAALWRRGARQQHEPAWRGATPGAPAGAARGACVKRSSGGSCRCSRGTSAGCSEGS